MIMVLAISTILGCSSTNWLTIWIMLEVNVLAMCSILTSNSKSMKKSETSTFMYYLIQVMLSIVIVTWVFYSMKENYATNLVVTMTILSKMGMWPMHGWYMKLISSLEMKQMSMMIIMTWQKILPVVLVTTIQTSQVLQTMVVIMVMGTILSSLARLNQKFEMKKIMAISSMNNNSWIVVSSLVSMSCMFSFLSIYSMTLVLTLSLMEKMSVKSKSLMKNFWLNTIMVANISGLPPLALFWAKILVIKAMMKSEMPSEMALTLMVSACLLMYHYLWMTINETTSTPEKSQMKTKSMKEKTTMVMVMSVSALSASMFMS
uniref:NADH-ubiquinone oxidoreductase chain 2 n=2 Tax=Tyrophagus putrescentiae TaxID=59818 RepID=A0A0A7CD18_TYRPU|nr:NADH dehydrogenase subunit 2 [Tyrophagus putrescentiae]AIB08711.1 NADH dehydrogenase subunit 2 [Tyrophagus putrescentiae]QIA92566.1 NADH dehydrogenase subunit 2 [Tyrophagus putrescentiae]